MRVSKAALRPEGHVPAVLFRDDGQCFKCGVLVFADRWPGYSSHHRRLRSGQGSDTFENRITLCGSGTTGCHGWVHHHRAEADANGWIVSRYGPDPADVPVLHWRRGKVHLTVDGRVLTPAEYAEEAARADAAGI